jgi:hypothetical protein
MVDEEKTGRGSEELISAMRKLAGRGRRHSSLDISPGCAFGAVVEERLRDLERHIDEVKGRLSGLLFLVTGAVVVQVIIKLAE